MKISSSVIRSTTRIRSLVALLTLTVLGSSWLVLRADVPRVASGTWAAAGEVVVPSGAVSVTLADGRVVVAGGKSDDTLSPVIASYDPASGAWARVGELLTARSGHAMTLLNDGRVLIAGGTASYGPTFDIEIFDPANGTSVHAGDMTLARVDHAAATLKDGRVLIVGGSDGVAPMPLAEIFDPATGQSQGVANAMSTARVKGHGDHDARRPRAHRRRQRRHQRSGVRGNLRRRDGLVLRHGADAGCREAATSPCCCRTTIRCSSPAACRQARRSRPSSSIARLERRVFDRRAPMAAPRAGAIAGGLTRQTSPSSPAVARIAGDSTGSRR